MSRIVQACLMELYAAGEFVRFTMRHRRYFTTAFFLYLYSFKSLKYAHFLRIGFAVLQHLDDVLDGDRKVGEDPLQYVKRLVKREPTSKTTKSQHLRMQRLMSYFYDILVWCSSPIHHTNEDFTLLLDSLILDYDRRANRLVFPAAKLHAHHYQTFFHSVNLCLAMSGSSKTAKDEEELVLAFIWCSPIRDIEADYEIGLINIPEEVVLTAKREKEDLFYSSAYKNWEIQEFDRVKEVFQQFETKADKDPFAKYFMKALKIYADKYERTLNS